MKCEKFILIIIFVLLCPSVARSVPANINVYPNYRYQHKISEQLNGAFIEFLLDFINGPLGIWSQEIQDRGFEEIFSNDSTYYHWKRWNANSDSLFPKKNVLLTRGGSNKSDSFNLQIQNANTVECGLMQQVWLCDTTSHAGYIYIKSDNAVGSASIVLFNTETGERLYEHKIEIKENDFTDWAKIEFSVPPISNVHTFNFGVTYKGTGKMYFDEVSLMPDNNFHGIRSEWEKIFKIWKPKMLRYPGGTFAEIWSFTFKFLIGDIDQRKSAIARSGTGEHSAYTQRCDFGLHEYMTICNLFEIQPIIPANILLHLPSGDIDKNEPSDFLQYCNSDTNTKMGKLRAKNGQIEPFNVKYWEIGNEPYFYFTPKEYAKIVCEESVKMKNVDSSIIITANFYMYVENWFRDLMDIAASSIDYASYHPTCTGMFPTKDEKLFYLNNMGTNLERDIILWQKETQNRYPHIRLATTEWWTFLLDTTLRPIEERWMEDVKNNLSLHAALWNSLYFTNLIKHSDIVDYATRTAGIGMVYKYIDSNGQKHILPSPQLNAMVMLNEHRGDYIVSNDVQCETFSINEPPYWADNSPYLDVTTTISNDSLFIAVINKHPDENIITNLSIENDSLLYTEANVYTFTAEKWNSHVSPENNEMLPTNKQIHIDNGNFTYLFPKHSITIIAIPSKLQDTTFPDTTDFIVYPSPMNLNIAINLSIHFNESRKINRVDLYDMSGCLLYKRNYDIFTNEITLKDIYLPTGNYILRITTDNKVYTRNVIIHQ